MISELKETVLNTHVSEKGRDNDLLESEINFPSENALEAQLLEQKVSLTTDK